MTRHACAAIALACAASVGEGVLTALTITDWSAVGANALLFAFLVGPLLFLALTAWRRRAHPARSRVLFWVAVAVPVGVMTVFGIDFYRHSTDAKFRQTPNMHGVLVPIVQWVVILVVWLWLVVQESHEKRAAKNRTQSA